MKIVLVVLALVGSSMGLIFNRECPSHAVHEDLDIDQYQGTWYEYRRYETSEQSGSDCATFEYYPIDGDSMKLISRWVYIEDNFRELYRNGTISRAAGAGSASRFNLVFNDEPNRNINYHILATNYYSFSLVWSCHNIGGGQSNEDAWVLSKVPNPDADEFEQYVGEYIDRYLVRENLRGTVQGFEHCTGIGETF